MIISLCISSEFKGEDEIYVCILSMGVLATKVSYLTYWIYHKTLKNLDKAAPFK